MPPPEPNGLPTAPPSNPRQGDTAAPPAGSPDAPVAFRCNLCGTHNVVPRSRLGRETPSCSRCGSTVRFRAMAHLLTAALFGEGIALVDLPARKDIVGIGLSDAHAYAAPLAKKLGYTNTWFHTEPRLDIANVPPGIGARYDFLIASDVFEHVAPPVSRAFTNARRILKPGGVSCSRCLSRSRATLSSTSRDCTISGSSRRTAAGRSTTAPPTAATKPSPT